MSIFSGNCLVKYKDFEYSTLENRNVVDVHAELIFVCRSLNIAQESSHILVKIFHSCSKDHPIWEQNC